MYTDLRISSANLANSQEIYKLRKSSSLPVDCQLGGWTGWGSCSAKCGGGTQTSTRVILRQAQHGGTACVGDLTRSQPCNTNDCPGMTSLNLFFLDNFSDIGDYWF